MEEADEGMNNEEFIGNNLVSHSQTTIFKM
jgi:hypothetical protein